MHAYIYLQVYSRCISYWKYFANAEGMTYMFSCMVLLFVLSLEDRWPKEPLFWALDLETKAHYKDFNMRSILDICNWRIQRQRWSPQFELFEV